MSKPTQASSSAPAAAKPSPIMIIGSIKKTCAKVMNKMPTIQANFSVFTILAVGMCLQVIVDGVMPHYKSLSKALPFILLAMRGIFVWTRGKDLPSNPYLHGAMSGKWTASVFNEDGELPERNGANGVVVFHIGFQINHPMGMFAPGVNEIGPYYSNMWKDAEEDAEKWGFLGKTQPLIAQGDSSHGNTITNTSYWKSIDHLRDFAARSSHAEGRRWWERTRAEWPHLGIFHETFVVQPHQYETIYENFHPFGLGATKQTVGSHYPSQFPLVPSEGHKNRSMDSRMGGN